MKTRIAFSLIGLALLAGCAPTYRGEIKKLVDQESWTNEQKRAAREYSYRYFGKQAEENGPYTVLYSRLPKKLVTDQLESFLADLDEMLSYQDKETNDYLKQHSLRPHFEHQEDIFKAIYARVRVAELHDVFEELLGQHSSYSSTRDEYGYDHAAGYDSAILALDPKDLASKFSFNNEVIDQAKKQGELKEISRFTLAQSSDLARKEPDPDFPDDVNKFVWKKSEYQLQVVTYKIMAGDDKPRDNNGNYAEVYRIVGGKPESLPAIRAFMDGSGGYVLAVIDVHRQTDAAGYGLPDFVERLPQSGLANTDMIARIFPEDSKTRRVEPKVQPIRVEIVPFGTEIDVWEKCAAAEGCKVPFPYKNEAEDNYTIELRFKKKKMKEGDSPTDRTREVEYIEKRWTPAKPGAGEVVEYFLPKEPFDKAVLSAEVVTRYNAPSKIEFVFPDGTEESIVVTSGANKAVKDKPQAVGYNWSGKRFVIKDFDNNGSYEKKREVGELSASSYGRMDDFGGNGGGHYHYDPSEPGKPEAEKSEKPQVDRPKRQ